MSKSVAALIAALALLVIGGNVTAQADPSDPMPCGSPADRDCPPPEPGPPGGYPAPLVGPGALFGIPDPNCGGPLAARC